VETWILDAAALKDDAVHACLALAKARSITAPCQANRAVIFDSCWESTIRGQQRAMFRWCKRARLAGAYRRPPTMHRSLILSVALASGLALAAPVALAAAKAGYTGQNLSPGAKVTMAQAEAIALKAHPGKIADKELEKEAGGSGLRYSFDVVAGGRTYEVGVDARDGKVLENVAEGAHPD
jgi:hypothetical protein